MNLIDRLKQKGVITENDNIEKDKEKVNLKQTINNSLPTRENLEVQRKESRDDFFLPLNQGKQLKYINTTNNMPSKENISNILKDAIKTQTKGVLPYIWNNYKQGLVEGTAGIAQGQILNASNEAKKISEKDNKNKLKDLNDTLLQTLNPIYGITRKSYEIGQNTLDNLKNKEKTTKQKVADILTNSVSEIKDFNNPIGNIVKQTGKTAGIIDKNAGNKLSELNEKIDKPIRNNREKLQQEGQNYSNVARMAGTVSNVVGNMTPSIIASRFGGGNEGLTQALSLGTMGLSAKGRATQEALNKGAELDKAIKIGDTKAMTEVGTELLTGGLNIFGKGALDNIVERGINKKVTNNVLNYLAKQGAGIVGEIGEETISDILNTVIDQGTVDPKTTYSMKDWSDTALTTMLSTVVLNALGGAYTPKAYNQNVQKMEQINAKQDITERINNSNLSETDKSNMINYVQNEDFTQADYNAMRETIENSKQPTNTISQEQINSLVERIDNSNLPNEDKLMMKDYIQNNNVSESDIESMNNVIDSSVVLPANNELITNQNFKDNVEARRKYAKYKNDTGEYNSKAINEVLDIIPENRNGNRTVKQWLQVAKETGTRIADLSNEEIERIAYKSWFDVQPSKNITKYDRQTKSTVGFQKLTSDEWVNEINKAVNEARANNQVQNENSNKSSFSYDEINSNNQENDKQKQLDIIQKNNPMTDDYHTGIRSIEDIKTFDEVINDEESFVYGDFSKEDAEKALKEGKVTVYSSNPIKQGSFVSTSQNMAKDYAGNGKIYSQEVNLKDVAWINGDEGQYAKIENNVANNQKNIVNNSKKVYNIINKSITNNERAQVSDEVRRWRINQENGLGYIDLSEKGYNSYIYNKQGGNVETILKVNGSEEFKNYIRKGVEDGTFSNAEGFNKSIAEIKNEYRKYRSSNDGMSGRKSNNRNDKLPTRQIRREGSSNTARDIKQNSGNESIENSNKSSFIIPTTENNKADNPKMPMNEKQEQEKVANILEKPQQQVKEKDRTWAILKAGLLDKGIVFEELSHKTKNRELQSKWDYTLSATARGQNAIGNARYEFDPKTKKQKQISKGLEDIRAEVGDRISDFNQYMYHLLNIDRMTLEERFGGDTGTNFENNGNITNKPVFSKDITADISRGIVEKLENKHSDFKDIAQDVYDYNNANKQELVRNGVISQELSDKLAEMYPHYVPIKRVDVKGFAIKVPLDTNRTGINSPLARATGGNSDIQPLFETMADRTMQTYRAGARNNFGVELLNTLNSQIESNNVDVDTIIDEIGSEDTELLKEGKNGENPTFTVFNNGEKTTFEITKDMYDALKPISDGSLLNKKILKGIPNKISNLRRGILTEYNPLFSITNALKDAQDVIINSQHTAKTFSKFPEAYTQILKKGYWFKEYVQNGGEQNSYFKDGEFTSDKKVPTAKKALSVPLEAISNVNNVVEMAPRLAEYIASRESGKSVETSMLDASRVTTNFKAGGDITKFANRNGATFLNASVQGFQQQIRNIKEANVKGLKGYAVLAGKYTVAGVIPAIINSLIWRDDKDYEDLQDYVKDNYYCIAKLGDGKFIRIPKGRMTATLQKIVSNIDKYVTDGKTLNIDNFAKDFWEDLKFGMDNVAPNNPLDNNVISPVIQAISNKSWYGEDIVPSRLQKKPDAQQYDETTDSLSKWLGEKLNKSPYKINYLLDQYSGGVGDIVLPMMTKQAENNVVEDKFTTDSVMKSKYPGKFFELKDQLETNNVSDYATDEDKLKYKYINEISSELSDLYNKKREIQNSNMSDKDKKAKLKEVQKDINKLAKDGLDNVEKIKTNNNIATFNNTKYYKYDGKWTELSDSDKEKTKNMNLSSFADYRNKLYKLSKDKKESEENVKTSDKIQILLDSKYSDKDKSELYKNYIGTNDTTFDVIKATGMNIDEYLKYKTQKFESDIKEDGTVKGKSSKNKKDKVENYLKEMDITEEQRLLLYALQGYATDKTEKNKLFKYIDSLDTNLNNKIQLFNKFSGFTVYKDGTIKY